MALACHAFGISRQAVTANALHPCISNDITFHVYVCRSVKNVFCKKIDRGSLAAYSSSCEMRVGQPNPWANQTPGPTKPLGQPNRGSIPTVALDRPERPVHRSGRFLDGRYARQRECT